VSFSPACCSPRWHQLIPARDLDDHDRLRVLVYSAIVD
jgi:hypothetical protein